MEPKIVDSVEVAVSDVDDEIEEVEIVVLVFVLVHFKMVMDDHFGIVVPKQPVEKIAVTIPIFFEVVNVV